MNKFLKGTFFSVLLLLVLCVAALPAAAEADRTADYNLLLSDTEETSSYLIDALTEELTVYDAATLYDLTCLGADTAALAERFAAAAKEALQAGNGLVLSYGTPSFSYTALVALTMLETGIFPEDITAASIAKTLLAMESDFAAENPYLLIRVLDLTEKYPAFFGEDNDTVRQSLKTALMGYYKADVVSGFDYYGLSTDTNANMILGLSAFADADETVAAALQAALAYLASQKTEAGYSFSTEYPGENANSTAMAMAAYAKSGDLETASAAFSALRGFRSAANTGAYVYGGEDSYSSTTDALRGMIVYKTALEAAGVGQATESPAATPTANPGQIENPETGHTATALFSFVSLGVMLVLAVSVPMVRKANEA